MIIKYQTSVYTPAGWRAETVTARAEKISDARARVVAVIDVGGNGRDGWASRTGARRQQYSVGGVARREIGAVKLIGRLEVIECDASAAV